MNSLGSNRQKMAIYCKELDSIKGIFNEKEKELSVAMAKVDALSRQLDELRDGNIINSYNINTTNSSSNELIGCQANSSNKLNVELEKLKQELLYRTKLNDKINEEMILKQKQIDQRTVELNNIDQRIADLKNRLNRKRNLNKQLNEQMKKHLLKTENNQSNALNDNLNNENDVPNCNSILKAKLRSRRSIGAGQPYKFTPSKNLKPFNAVDSSNGLDLKRQPKSDLNLTVASSAVLNDSRNVENDRNERNDRNDRNDSNGINGINGSNDLNATSEQVFNKTCLNVNPDSVNKHSQLNNLKTATIQSTPQSTMHSSIQSITHQSTPNNYSVQNDCLINDNQQKLVTSINVNDKYLNNSIDYFRTSDLSQTLSSSLLQQRLIAMNNTAKYLVVDQRQKDLLNLKEFNNEFNDKFNLSDNLSDFKDKFKADSNVNNSLKLNLNSLSNVSNDDLIKQQSNISPVHSTESSVSDFQPSNCSSNSDLPTNTSTYGYPPTHKLNLVYYQTVLRFTNIRQQPDRDGIEKSQNTYKTAGKQQPQQGQQQSQQQAQQTIVQPIIQSNIKQSLPNQDSPIDNNPIMNSTPLQSNSQTNVFNNLITLQDKDQNKRPIVQTKPDLIESSSLKSNANTDQTDFQKNDLSTNLMSNDLINHDDKKRFSFGLLQTSANANASSKSNTDSESDLCSETSPNYKSSQTKSASLNDSLPPLNNSYANDLKISIDNSDWLRKRRPLMADIDLEKHFETINNSLNDQLVFNSNESFNDEKSNLMNKELDKENYCNGNLNSSKEHLDKHFDKPKINKPIDNLEVLSCSSSSNHSPSSLDELDANKIELRSVIRNIMCKNLGSSSDKSSSTMSEEETDEDENSVDCKAKINNVKPTGIKLSSSTKTNHQNNSRLDIYDGELNKPKEKSNLINNQNNKLVKMSIQRNDEYNSADEKENSDNQLNYDSNNSEERNDHLSSKDDLSNPDVNDNQVKPVKTKSKSNLKKQFGIKNRRVSFDPLAILLDAALEGELDLVKKTASQVSNPSASFEGVTALHNSICANHFDICKYLIQIGCDVNAQDHDGWTPIHCAASVGNLPIIMYLVEHGACIFAVTLSDHETPTQKCEEMESGFEACLNYLKSMEEKLGTINGTVYAAYDYTAQQPDELSFKCNEQLKILDKSDPDCETESDWWLASNSQQQKGYIPRNLLSLYPRVVPKPKSEL